MGKKKRKKRKANKRPKMERRLHHLAKVSPEFEALAHRIGLAEFIKGAPLTDAEVLSIINDSAIVNGKGALVSLNRKK